MMKTLHSVIPVIDNVIDDLSQPSDKFIYNLISIANVLI
jgi:hypothetical protein